MGLFGKKRNSLDKMIEFSEEMKQRKLLIIKPGQLNDCFIYKDGHWEIQFLLGAPERLCEALRRGTVVNVSFSVFTIEIRNVPMMIVLFRFDDNYQLSYATIASVDSLGERKTELESLNYFDILLSQPEISYIQKAKEGNYNGKIKNPLLKYPQMNTIKDAIETSIKKIGYSSYQMNRINALSSLSMEAMIESKPGFSEYEILGQKLWDTYEGSL